MKDRQILFRLLGDRGHGMDGLHRVIPGGGFPGQHDGAGAVEHGVGHVGDLGAGGGGVHHHGIQHLRGGDDHLPRAVALADDGLLDAGEPGVLDLHAHIAAGDHDAVRNGEDFLEIVDAFPVFDLGDDLDVVRPVVVEELADILDVFFAAHERGGH